MHQLGSSLETRGQYTKAQSTWANGYSCPLSSYKQQLPFLRYRNSTSSVLPNHGTPATSPWTESSWLRQAEVQAKKKAESLLGNAGSSVPAQRNLFPSADVNWLSGPVQSEVLANSRTLTSMVAMGFGDSSLARMPRCFRHVCKVFIHAFELYLAKGGQVREEQEEDQGST